MVNLESERLLCRDMRSTLCRFEMSKQYKYPKDVMKVVTNIRKTR